MDKPDGELSQDNPQDENFSHEDIHDKDLSEILSSADFEEKDESIDPPEDTPPIEDKKEETPVVEPPKEDEKEEVKPPVIDEDALADKLSEKAADKIVERMLAKSDKTKEEKKDILADAPWKKENREPTYEEALAYVAEQAENKAVERVKEELTKEMQEEEEKERQAKEEVDTYVETRKRDLNTMWDTQIADLEKSGKLPKIADDKNDDDPGMKARVALYTKMHELQTEKVARGETLTESDYNLKLVYYENPDIVKPAQPPGADAPIAGGGRTVSQPNPNSFNYADVKADWDDILPDTYSK